MKNVNLILALLIFIGCSESNPDLLTPEGVKYTTSQKLIEEGNDFPKFNEIDSENREISDRDFNKGNVLYIFWSTRCSSCIDNIVAVRDMKRQGLLNNIQFVSVSIDREKKNWEQFIYQYDMNDYMTNILIGKNQDHILSHFLYKKLYTSLDLNPESVSYNYVTPSYCLVKDGVIASNTPILPKDKQAFLEVFN